MPDTAAPTQPPEAALTFEETRQRLSVGRTTLFRLIESGEVPSFKIGRLRRFLASDVDDYLRRKAATTDRAA